MNSEELEASLRTEFENYLKDIFVEMRQEVLQLQEKLDAELERHKTQLSEVFDEVLNRFDSKRELDPSFKDTVIEHLRLSKDEGARITATAIAQAEDMERDSAPAAGIKEVYEAVSDISSKTSQADILKSLVQHSANFAPRGAFFIVKNEHLVGWRVFDKEKDVNDDKVRELFLPLSSNSILGEAVQSLETVKSLFGAHTDDADIFRQLDLGESQAVAFPLVARGRGVAVLYAEHGAEGVNIDALETIIRVAGLTVEVLASAKGSVKKDPAYAAPVEDYAAPIAETSKTESAPPQETAKVDEQTAFRSSYNEPTAYQPIETESEYQTVEPESAEQVDKNDYQSSDDEDEKVYQPSDENAYQSPAQETDDSVTETENYKSSLEIQPFFVQEPSIAPSVQDSAAEESVEQDFTADSDKSADYQTEDKLNDYQVEEIHGADIYETEPAQAVAEEDKFSDSVDREEEEKYSTPAQTAWSQPTETQDFSAQKYAENFAKETDPTEYAKDFPYQTEDSAAQAEELKTDEAKDFEYQPSSDAEISTNAVNDYQVEPTETNSPDSSRSFSSDSFNTTTEAFTPTPEQTYGTSKPATQKDEPSGFQSFETVSQPVQPTASKSRLSERNVDLPIEVGEDERRLHNDARRFARLLVSEIKLYNEQKVKEGRASNDLYDRLREAIDRSREMYDKRVQPPVAAKFDYFHYELVNTLAEGDDNKLGAGYPGSNVVL